MHIADIYPEPDNIKLLTGAVSCGVQIDERALSEEIVQQAGSFFKRDFNYGDLTDGAYYLNVSDNNITIAAMGSDGFYYASRLLAQLRTKGNSVKRGVIFDYPHKCTRGVYIKSDIKGNTETVFRLLKAMSQLKYNTLYLGEAALRNITEDELKEIELYCEKLFIKTVVSAGEPEGLICGLDGPSYPDWEHKDVRERTKGAYVILDCKLDAESMADSGFLFNLVYSAWMLWRSDYNNFSWEKVNDQACRIMPAVMRIFRDGIVTEADMDDTDIFELSGPSVKIPCSQTVELAKAGEKADCLIFRHRIEVDNSSSGGEAVLCGHYTVHYMDNTVYSIPLIENRNIGRGDLWCGRKYNSRLHRFDTDRRLQSICCFAGIERKILTDGRLSMVYKMTWSNPYPDKVIDMITGTAYMRGNPYEIVVEEIEIANGIDKQIDKQIQKQIQKQIHKTGGAI